MKSIFGDVTCPNGHKTTPDMTVCQTKQKCMVCGKNYGVTAFGEVLDTDILNKMIQEIFPEK